MTPGCVLVLGDSDLTIAFMQHRARPGKQELVTAVMGARHWVKVMKGRCFGFKYIMPKGNVLVDWLCRLALTQLADQNHVEKVLPALREDSPAPLVLDLSQPSQQPATPVDPVTSNTTLAVLEESGQ